MATMYHKHVNANVVYVDAAATGTNDGTTPSNALTVLPAITAMAANTVYLLRRGQTQTFAPGTTAVAGLGIIGMPMSTDTIYDAVPAEAKTAWGGDVGTYAQLNILLNTVPVLFNGCIGLTLHRLDCVSTQTLQNPAVAFMSFPNCMMVSVTRCRSRLNNFALTTSTVMSTKTLTAWSFTGCIGLAIRSSWFERPIDVTTAGATWNTATFKSTAIDISGCSDVFVEDLDLIWGLPGYAGTVETGCGGLRVTQSGCEYAVLRSLRFVIVETRDPGQNLPANAGSWMPVLSATLNRARISNVTVTARKMGTGAAPSGTALSGIVPLGASATAWFTCLNFSNSGTTGIGGDAAGLFGVDISNVSIDLTNFSTACSGMSVGNDYATSSANNHYNMKWSVTNFTFYAPQTVGCTHDSGGTFGPYPVGLSIGALTKCVVDTIDIRYPNTQAVALDVGQTDAQNLAGTLTDSNTQALGIIVKNATLVGALAIEAAYVDVISLTMAVLSAAATFIRAINSAQVNIRSLVLPASYATANCPMTASQNAQIMVGVCNIAATWQTAVAVGTLNINNHVAVANDGGVTGSWKAYSPYANVVTTSVYRTGGAAAALVVKTPTTPSREYGPWLSPFPYAAKFIDPGTTGRRIVCAYIAIKGFTTLYHNIFNSIEIFVESPLGTYPATRQYLSSTDGWMEDDASAWVNDAGLAVKCIKIPIQVDRYENLGIRVHFLPIYENAAYYYYFDPKLVVIAG